MNDTLNIRPYTAADKPAVMELLALNIPEYFASAEAEDLSSYLDKAAELYFVVELNSRIVGAGGINFENGQRIGKISWDIIHPGFQGAGIGSRLLLYRLRLLQSMKSIRTISVRTSQLAYRFYEKHGFQLQEVHKDYWAAGLDMYKMVYHGTR